MDKSKAFLDQLCLLAEVAGKEIMQVYESDPMHDEKQDGSPVTLADKNAEAVILEGLKKLAPDVPVISEENEASHEIIAPPRYFLVDPLDGTREFIKRDGKGAFTVNIALVEEARPVIGVVYAPVLGRLFSGIVGLGAYDGSTRISVRDVPETGPVALASVSHRDEKTNLWLDENNITETVSIGSSLKFGMIACGEADVYPRFSPTMEWDTAAGHAILEAAGGKVVHPDGGEFLYGKHGYLNTPFIASGKFGP